MRLVQLTRLIAVLAAGSLLADVVELNDGSRFTGEIKGMAGDKVTIATKHAGTLSLPLDVITGLQSDNEIFVHLASGSVLKGKVSRIGGKTTVATVNGSLDVSKDAIANVWPEGTVDPRTPPPPLERTWKYQAAVDIGGKTGNTEKFGTYSNLTATLEGDKDRLKFYGRGGRSREESIDTVREIIGGIDYEADFGRKYAWYVRGEMEYDEIETLDLRSTAAVGFARYLIKEDDTILRARAGFLFRHETYQSGVSTSQPGLDLGLSYKTNFGEWAKLSSDVTFTPAFEDLADYRVYHESKLEIPINRSPNWAMQLGLSNEYNSTAAAPRRELDTTYFLRLAFTWD